MKRLPRPSKGTRNRDSNPALTCPMVGRDCVLSRPSASLEDRVSSSGLLAFPHLNVRLGQSDHLGQDVCHVQILHLKPLFGSLHRHRACESAALVQAMKRSSKTAGRKRATHLVLDVCPIGSLPDAGWSVVDNVAHKVVRVRRRVKRRLVKVIRQVNVPSRR